jgi:hypothetical protein
LLSFGTFFPFWYVWTKKNLAILYVSFGRRRWLQISAFIWVEISNSEGRPGNAALAKLCSCFFIQQTQALI